MRFIIIGCTVAQMTGWIFKLINELLTSFRNSDANDVNLSEVLKRRQEEKAELILGRRTKGAKAQSRSKQGIQPIARVCYVMLCNALTKQVSR
jgi:hypothetical protein